MKRCPTCSRTFEDSLTYCLIDGSVLSAPFGDRSDGGQAEATHVLPVNDSLDNTEGLTPAPTMPAMYQAAATPRSEPPATIAADQKKPYLLVAVVAITALFFLIGISVLLFLNRTQPPSYIAFLLVRRLPIFLIVAVGVILSLVRVRRHPRASLLTIWAMVLLAFVAIFFTLLLLWLTRDMSAAEANRFYDIGSVIQNIIFAAETVLLVAAAYSDRRPLSAVTSGGT